MRSKFTFVDTGPWIDCVCKTCQNTFQVRRTNVRRGEGHYCSKQCYWSRPRPSLEERFWSNVSKSDDCWDWTGNLASTGYGQLWVKGRAWGHVMAHRFSYELHKGEIAPGLEVCHTCDRRECVRPDHLFLGTQAENIADMVSKDRHSKHERPRGEASGNVKLTEAQVREIHALKNGPLLTGQIAIRFGVTKATIRNIWKQRTWKHVA